MDILVEEKYGHGGIVDIPDRRDYKWDVIGKAAAPFAWGEGYDIEATLGRIFSIANFRLTVNDQGTSSSCGGQAFSKYGEVLDMIFDGGVNLKSAKFIYAQVFVAGGGSRGRDICDLLKNKGWGNEADVPSTKNGNPPDEPFMERRDDISLIAFENAKTDEALSYANTGVDIDSIAQAIRENYGVVLGFYGQNNGTWLTERPTPPSDTNPNQLWAHWVYAGRARINNGKKEIGFLNSWGKDVGDNGWQWLTEDYFNAKINGTPVIFSGWTLVFDVTKEQIEGRPANWLMDLVRRFIAIFK